MALGGCVLFVSASSPWFGIGPLQWIKAVNWCPQTWALSSLSLWCNTVVLSATHVSVRACVQSDSAHSPPALCVLEQLELHTQIDADSL